MFNNESTMMYQEHPTTVDCVGTSVNIPVSSGRQSVTRVLVKVNFYLLLRPWQLGEGGIVGDNASA